MSDIMKGVSFRELLLNTLNEYEEHKTCYHVPVFNPTQKSTYEIAGKPAGLPLGPAAGPHTQLAQNIIAGFIAGARIFELKTVQIMEGKQLGIKKPCIYVVDEAYNTEWSTELKVYEAAQEYIKSYIILHLIANEFDLKPDFQFHISVGYDLEGIKSEKIDNFLNTMKNASNTDFWNACINDAINLIPKMKKTDETFIRSICPNISDLVTLSTMHGCPPNEIEKIAIYLIEEKGFNTYIKCNPTLIGYEDVRNLLDSHGYNEITFDKAHFEHDMKLKDAIEMIKSLQDTAKQNNKIFGVKLTNTFPVKINNDELAGDTMYMSGKPLFLLSINVARKLATAFDGMLPISFSGGIDFHNIKDVMLCGISPVTVATLLLKTGGYKNISKLADLIPENIPCKIDLKKLNEICEDIHNDSYYNIIKPKGKPQKTQPPKACYKCKNCVDVCPNRANFPINDIKSCVHIESYCNECGNCACFCPFGYVPYRDKFTYFETKQEFENSENDGFLNKQLFRLNGKTFDDFNELPEDLQNIVNLFLERG